MEKKYVVFMGPPGAGKGTQAKLLSGVLGLPHISTGDLFRYNLTVGTQLGQLAKSFMNKGELVPDEVTVAMVRQRLTQPDCVDGCILDGFPRTLEQLAALEQLLEETGGDHDVMVLLVDVPDEELLKRIKQRAEEEGRSDDSTPEVVANRLQIFREQTAPLIAHFEDLDILFTINGEQGIREVLADILVWLLLIYPDLHDKVNLEEYLA